MEERNAERHAFSPRRPQALITAVPGYYDAAEKLAAFGAGTGRQPLTVRPFVRSSRTGNSGNIIPIGDGGVKNTDSQKSLPPGGRCPSAHTGADEGWRAVPTRSRPAANT